MFSMDLIKTYVNYDFIISCFTQPDDQLYLRQKWEENHLILIFFPTIFDIKQDLFPPRHSFEKHR